MTMSWKDLYNFLQKSKEAEWFNDSVYTYDRAKGEYYSADLVEFEDDDDIIDRVVFVEFESFT